MTTLSPVGSPRLTGQDLVRLKKYLIDTISRTIEMEGISFEQRSDFIKERIEGIYAQAKLKLPEDMRRIIFTLQRNY